MEESIVKVEHLSHRYSIQWAIRDINIEITRNGIYGLLGSNGAGKSTTMNIICGVLKQTEGEVYIKGINLRENPVEAKKHLGFLPQKPPLHMDLTVEEYLVHCANMRLIPAHEVQGAVKDVMGRCGISHFSRRLIRNLSGGYQQRLGIAQAIIHNPDFVVLDEPTNGLDPNQIVEIRELIREIAVDRTVILSTHILSEVQATCDYIRMIEEGQVVFYVICVVNSRTAGRDDPGNSGCGCRGRTGWIEVPDSVFGCAGSNGTFGRGQRDKRVAISRNPSGKEFLG